LYQKYNLDILELIRYGFWSGRKNWVSYQDFIVATKLR
jgi:hypothetical protein